MFYYFRPETTLNTTVGEEPTDDKIEKDHTDEKYVALLLLHLFLPAKLFFTSSIYMI